jgi:putative ABC transport system permease protein
MERSARVRRGADQDIGRVQPLLLERGGGPSSAIPALGPAMVSAITVRLAAGVDPLAVAETISGWPDVSVHTKAGQHELLVYGMIDKARRQIGLFRVLLIIISTIIMALILYTLTLDKIHDIALLKLMGARNSMIVGLILQQALLLGVIGYGIAYLLGQWVFPKFPRRVLIRGEDLWGLALVVVVISVLASLLGIWKAMRVEPNKVLS